MSQETVGRTDPNEAFYSADPSIATAEKKRRRNRLVASIAGGATMLTGVFIAGTQSGGEAAKPDSDRNTVSAGKDPTATQTPDVAVTPKASETPIPVEELRESNIYDMSTLSEEENALVERMDAMNVEDFEAMPLEKRLIYVIGQDHKVMSKALFSDYFTQTLNDGNSLARRSFTANPLNENSTADQISLQSAYGQQLVLAWTLNEENDNDQTIDPVTSRKMRSAYALDPKSAVYNTEFYLDNENIASQLNEDLLNFAKTTEGDKTTVINPIDGTKTVQKKIYSVMTGGEYEGTTNEATYVFIPMDKQLGEGNGLWLQKEATQFN